MPQIFILNGTHKGRIYNVREVPRVFRVPVLETPKIAKEGDALKPIESRIEEYQCAFRPIDGGVYLFTKHGQSKEIIDDPSLFMSALLAK